MEKIEKVEVGRREGLRGRKEKEYVVESRRRGRKWGVWRVVRNGCDFGYKYIEFLIKMSNDNKVYYPNISI